MAGRRPPRVQSGPLRSSASASRQLQLPGRTVPTPSRMTSSAESARSSGGKIKLTYSEIRGRDLFDCPKTASLVHCVSEDMHMGKGIATEFKKRFKGVEELKAQGTKTGGVAVLEREDRCIFYLVTKARYFHKPTYDTMRSSLCRLHEQCTSRGIAELCMPRIGCGRDKLEWDRVKDMIRDIFAEHDMTITVYSL